MTGFILDINYTSKACFTNTRCAHTGLNFGEQQCFCRESRMKLAPRTFYFIDNTPRWIEKENSTSKSTCSQRRRRQFSLFSCAIHSLNTSWTQYLTNVGERKWEIRSAPLDSVKSFFASFTSFLASTRSRKEHSQRSSIKLLYNIDYRTAEK